MKKNISKIRKLFLLCLGLISAALIILTIWDNTALMVNEFSISSDRLPASFSGFRIAQVSDLHNAKFGKDNVRLLQMLSECQPDMIAITGDLIDVNHTYVEVAVNFSQKAALIAPVYYVPGNHEAKCSEYDTLKTGLETAGGDVPGGTEAPLPLLR